MARVPNTNQNINQRLGLNQLYEGHIGKPSAGQVTSHSAEFQPHRIKHHLKDSFNVKGQQGPLHKGYQGVHNG